MRPTIPIKAFVQSHIGDSTDASRLDTLLSRATLNPHDDYSDCAQECMEQSHDKYGCQSGANDYFPCFCENVDAGLSAIECIESECSEADVLQFDEDLDQCIERAASPSSTGSPAESRQTTSAIVAEVPSTTFESRTLTASTQAQLPTGTTSTSTLTKIVDGESASSLLPPPQDTASPIGTGEMVTGPATSVLTTPSSSHSAYLSSTVAAVSTTSLNANTTSANITASSLQSSPSFAEPRSSPVDSSVSASARSSLVPEAIGTLGHFKLAISICVPLAFAVLAAIIGALLIWKRRQRQLRQCSSADKHQDGQRSGEGTAGLDAAKLFEGCENCEEISDLGLSHGRQDKPDPFVVMDSISDHIPSRPPSVISLALASHRGSIDILHVDALDVHETSEETQDPRSHLIPPSQGKRRKRQSATVNCESALSAEARLCSIPEISVTPQGPYRPSHPPFEQAYVAGKDITSPTTEPHQRCQRSQQCPRSDLPLMSAAAPAAPRRDTQVDVARSLPLRLSAGSPPHLRFVAVLMEINQDADSDEPPPVSSSTYAGRNSGPVLSLRSWQYDGTGPQASHGPTPYLDEHRYSPLMFNPCVRTRHGVHAG